MLYGQTNGWSILADHIILTAKVSSAATEYAIYVPDHNDAVMVTTKIGRTGQNSAWDDQIFPSCVKTSYGFSIGLYNASNNWTPGVTTIGIDFVVLYK